MKRRLLATLLCLCIALTLLPTAALAATMYIDREPSGSNGYTFQVSYAGTEPVSYQWYRPEGGQANFTVIDVSQTPGASEICCNYRWSGSCANGVWSSDDEHKLDVAFPAYAGDTVQIQISGGEEVTVQDHSSKQSYEDKGSGLYSFVVQKTGDSNPVITSTAAFTATITVQRQWDALEGETQAALQTREPGEYFCVATAGTASKVSETVTIGPAVIRADYTASGAAKAASFTEDELKAGSLLSTMLGESADADTPATLTLLADSMADLGLDHPATLTSGDGGPYTLTRDPAEYQMRLLEVTAPVTVTNLTLDGSVTEPKSSEAPRFIEVSDGSLTLGDGATVQNCQPNTKHKKQPPAAVYVSSGSLIMESGSKIVNNQSQMGGVVREYGADVSLSGNVTIQGNEALDIETGATVPANLVVCAPMPKALHESVQVTGPLTGGEKSIGITLVESVLDPQPTTGPVVEGAGHTLTETDLAAFFSDRPGYFLELADNTISLEEYAITTQPTAEVPTVAVNQSEGAAYQWYAASLATEAVTDQNTAEGPYPCTYADGKWTAGMNDGDKGWFTLALKKGDMVTVTVAEGETIPTNDSLCLYDYTSEEMDTVAYQPDKTVYTLTAPADGTYTLEPVMGIVVPVISAKVTRVQLGQAVSGQDTDTLAAPAAGDYLCQVTYPDGTVLQSDLISVAAAPHKHAVSVDCETTGEGLVTFDKALTVNDAGVLCVNGAALIPNSYGTYTLGGGSYYLPEDVTLNGDIIIRDADDAPTNLCLGGHTLDLGTDGSITVGSSTNNGNGVLNLCDCGAEGKITSAYSNSDHAVIFSEYSFSLYGGTVRSTGASTPALHLNGGTANLYGGKLVSDQGNGLSIFAWQAKGLNLSGDVTIQGGADQAEVYFDTPSSTWENNAHFTLTGPLTQPQTPWRVAVEDEKPLPLVTGWSTYMNSADFDDYFRSVDGQSLFVEQRENGDLAMAQCAITQQPTANNGYTVAANGAPASVPAYQWYLATRVTVDITPDNATAYTIGSNTATYDPAAKLWTGVGSDRTRYFTIHLLKDETVTVKPNAPLSSPADVCLYPEPYQYSYLVRLDGDEANEAGEYVLTAPAERDYIFTYESNERAGGAAPAFSAKVKQIKLGAALAGQDTPTLTATQAGTYLCRVTWPNGAKLYSDMVTYALPHVHAMSVDCETTGDDLVTFDKALTSVDGKLYVGGAEAPSEPINMSGVDMTQYQLPSGHYYLADDVTLADKSYLFFGTDGSEDADVVVDLCLNGHVLDLGGSHSRMSVAGSAQLRVCDCGDGGAVRGAYTSNERLGAMVNVTGVLELYGGAVENTATPDQDEQARAVALFMGVATLHGGQVIAGHDVALQYDTSAAGLTLYDGVTLQGGADSAEVWLSDVLGYGDDPLLTIAQPLTKPSTPWRLASSKARTLTDGWATHMADADFNDYFTCIDQGRCVEKTASGELALVGYAITAQPSAANGYTVTANGAPSGYQWYTATVTTAEITDQNATPYEFITGSIAPASYENGKWTAAQSSEAPEATYFTVALQKGDKVTLTLDQLPTQGQLGLYAYGKGQLWCYFGGSREPDKGVSIDGSVITYVIPADGDYKLMLDGLGDGQTAPALSAQLTRVTAGEAVSGQTSAKLTAAPEGDYLCRVSWSDGTTVDSDVVTYAPPAHVHDWATAWTTNDTHHWHECTADSCDVTENSGKDGYAAHAATGDWQKDETNHWKLCVCGQELNKTEHVYDDDADTTCNTCGYTRAVTPPTPDQGEAKGEVEVKPGTPDVDVDEEALKDLAGEVAEGETVTVKLTVEKQDDPADKADIEALVTGDKENVLYLDLSLLKQVNDGEAQAITDAARVLEIAVAYDFTGKKDVTVYRKHGDNGAEKLTALAARPTENYADGSFFADSANGVVYIYASKFSTYAIGYTAETTPVSPSRPSSGGRPGTVRPSESVWPFTDVKTTDPGYEAVKYVYEKGWMLGTSDTTFSPDGQLTRAMLAAVLYRAAGSPKAAGAPEFEDTQAGQWYSDAIAWASQTQVLRGYGNGQFGPNDPVSREMLNMVMGRLRGQDPAWVGDPALAAPATRTQIAQALMEQDKA